MQVFDEKNGFPIPPLSNFVKFSYNSTCHKIKITKIRDVLLLRKFVTEIYHLFVLMFRIFDYLKVKI
jgi:hypothetical protein